MTSQVRAADSSTLAGAQVLVLGASGFIGSHLVRAVHAKGARVVGVSRATDAAQQETPELAWERCDAGDGEQIRSLLRRYRPDIVYLLTSSSQGGRGHDLVDACVRGDLLPAIALLTEVARFPGAHVVMAGSFEEPMGDTFEIVPSSPYAAAKWASTVYARMFSALYQVPVINLRLMMTYGPGQKDYKVIPYTILRLQAGLPAHLGKASRMLDWVYVDDVVDAFVRAGASRVAQATAIDVGSGRLIRLKDVLSTIGRMMNRESLLQFGAVPDRPLEREGAADLTRAGEVLDWHPRTPLEVGLARTIEAYRRAPN